MRLTDKIKLSLIAAFFATVSGAGIRSCHQEVGLANYAKSIAPKIIEKHEKLFGIDYQDKVPIITASGVYMMDVINGDIWTAGSYQSQEGVFSRSNKIDLSSFLNNYPSKGRWDRILGRYQESGYTDAENTLSHELGHFYADIRSEELGKGDWPKHNKYSKIMFELNSIRSLPEEVNNFKKKNQELLTERLAINAISEGIALYIGNEGENISDFDKFEFTDKDWPETYSDMEDKEYDKLIYVGGYSIVKPILDKFGVKKGIDHLISNMPKIEKLGDFPLYRKKVLEALEK